MTGESLGTIGQVGSEAGSSVPSWKRKLLAKPSVSVRQGISLGFGSAEENTSTLVLTSIGSWFVDVRFALGDEPTNTGAFWAFAGKSEMSFPSSSSGGDFRRAESVEIPCMAHCVWKHEIDNCNMGPSYTDEGDIYLLNNGECVEIGMMQNAARGKVELYKEYWTAIEVEKGRPCVVARTEQRAGHQNGVGMVIRVADYCQSIFQKQGIGANENGKVGEVHVERWLREKSGTRHESGRWTKDNRSSTGEDDGEDIVVPSKWVCEHDRKIGDSIELLGRRWEIVECS